MAQVVQKIHFWKKRRICCHDKAKTAEQIWICFFANKKGFTENGHRHLSSEMQTLLLVDRYHFGELQSKLFGFK